jgi:hypothetical protein
VQLDPESGEPYDPTVVPTSGGGDTEIEKICVVVFRPIHVNVEDPIFTGPSGLRRGESVALILDPGDFPDVEHATVAEFNSVEYRVTEIIPDGLVDTDRYIVFLEAR